MFANYIKIALRNLLRNKLYSFINIAGLAMGISAFVLLLQYVSLEKSVNQFHANLPQMYRLLNESPDGKTWPEHAPGWAKMAKSKIPAISSFCRFEEGSSKGIVKNEAKNISFREFGTGYVDGNFFDFFTFPLRSGDPKAINNPDVTFISESTSKKYFGDENPLEKTLTLFNQFGKHTYTVKGVFKNIEENSDIRYDIVFSLATLNNPANLNGNSWAKLDEIDSQYINIFFQLDQKADLKSVEQSLNALRKEFDKESDGAIFRLQPFSEVHLAPTIADTYNHSGDVKYVYMLLGVAFLILLIAWFNYINLSTANTLKRANEVGVRKVIGASQNNLVLQFLGESMLVNVIALAFSIVLVILLQPLFNQVVSRSLSFSTLSNSSVWYISLFILMAGSLASGVYTAFMLSNFKPVETLKGKIAKTAKGVWLRKSLVVSQFGISIALILATVLIYSQIEYMSNKDLGLNLNQLLVIAGPEIKQDTTFKSRKAAFWNDLAKQSFVKDYASSGSVPSKYYSFKTGGFTQPASKAGDEKKTYSFLIVGERYFNTYGIKLVAGRNFTKAEAEVEWNDNSKVVLNETAIKEFGFRSAEEAVRTKIKWDERYLEVIGVAKDYNHTSLQNKIEPVIFYPQASSSYITVKLSAEKMPKKIALLENIFKKHFSGNPFEYTFLDDNFKKAYSAEKQYGYLFTSAAIWAIFIACLGLFGLASYTVESRTKEIGIRKVLGASVLSITTLISKDFMLLIGIALMLASPLAYYFMHGWLQKFAYRIDIEWWHFALTGTIAVLIALLTLSYQAIKAALMNPVKSLKTE